MTTQKIYIACDHNGYDLKEDFLKNYKGETEIEFVDFSPSKTKDPNDDYNDGAIAVAKAVSRDNLAAGANVARGILICNSGQGMAMQANRFKGVRAVVAQNEDIAADARRHLDANVVCIPACEVNQATAFDTLTVFCFIRYKENENYARRIAKLDNYGSNLD